MSTAAPEYQELVKQNWGFLSPEDQALISRTRVLLAGCGVGSNIAVLATRTGFCHFLVADGDTVEVSNLNRQAFRREHLGQNKADATASLVREINPEAQVQVISSFLSAEDTAGLVPQCDLIVNMVDPGPVLHALLKDAREQGKICLFPLNLGFGSVLLAFGPQSPSLEELMGPETGPDLFVRVVERLMPSLPPYLRRFAWVVERMQREQVPPPQLGMAVSITASLVVESMVKVALGSSPPLVPTVITLDPQEPALRAWPTAQPGDQAPGALGTNFP